MEKIHDALQYTTDTCSAVFNNFAVKCASALGILVAQFSFAGVESATLVAIGFLIIADFITAIIAEKINKAKITSRKMSKSAVKATVYALMVATGSFTEIVIGAGINLPITETIAGFIAATELISILENVGHAGYIVPKRLLNALKEFRDDK